MVDFFVSIFRILEIVILYSLKTPCWHPTNSSSLPNNFSEYAKYSSNLPTFMAPFISQYNIEQNFSYRIADLDIIESPSGFQESRWLQIQSTTAQAEQQFFAPCIAVVPNLLGTKEWFCGGQFSTNWGRGWFQDDSSTLHLLCILFMLLLHQLHLRWPGSRSCRLRTPVVRH